MKNCDRTAFPNHERFNSEYSGLTKREYFASMVMQGLCSNPNVPIKSESDVAQFYASCAVKFTDELIKQLES